MDDIDIFKLIYSKPINNYEWLFCNNNKIKEYLLKIKVEEINHINNEIKKQTNLEMNVLDYGYSYNRLNIENRTVSYKYIVVYIKKYNIIVAFMNEHNNYNNDDDYDNENNNNFYIYEEYYWYYYYNCDDKQYYSNRDLNAELLDIKLVLDYNIIFDKYIENI